VISTANPIRISLGEFDRLMTLERTKRAVRRTLDLEERPLTPIPPAISLTERFAMARSPTQYRIEGWLVVGGHVVLIAQYKSGKTTLVGNVVRSLADGGLFLGVAQVHPVRSIVILDFEMDERQIERWLRDQDIRNTDRVRLVSLRGAARSFDILNPERRLEWAAHLRSVAADFVIVDCLRPAMDALGLDEHNEAGRWFTAFDELLKDAGVPEALVVHHSGHGGDRSRGDSRILDWPDGIWNLVRSDRDDLNSPRFITAKGRDIGVEEGELTFDPITRHLTYTPRSRRMAGAGKVMRDVLSEIARATEPLSIREVTALMRDSGHSKGRIESALKKASDRTNGYLSRVKGPKGSFLHSITAAGREFLAGEDEIPEAPRL
jgi:hypothetical protein